MSDSVALPVWGSDNQRSAPRDNRCRPRTRREVCHLTRTTSTPRSSSNEAGIPVLLVGDRPPKNV